MLHWGVVAVGLGTLGGVLRKAPGRVTTEGLGLGLVNGTGSKGAEFGVWWSGAISGDFEDCGDDLDSGLDVKDGLAGTFTSTTWTILAFEAY